MEDFISSNVQILINLHYQYTEEFFAALLPMAITVFLHGCGMRLVGSCFRHFTRRRRLTTVVLVLIVAIMLATAYVEICAWATFYYWAGMMPDVKVAMYYSINAYSTLGASGLTLASHWKGLGGFEAMTAMLMFGWSTAMLVTIVQKSHGIDDK